MNGRMRWLWQGMGVAGMAACAFGLPWGWSVLNPPEAPYSSPAPLPAAAHRAAPEPLRTQTEGAALAGLRVEPPTPLPGTRWIYIDLRSRPQTLTCYDGLQPVMRFTVSGSRMGTDDVGSCRIRRKDRRHWYAPDRYWMEWWMTLEPLTPEGRSRARIRGLNGLHATPVSNYGRLGRPASHGCIRMRREEAERVWQWAPVGTDVYIYKVRSQRYSLPAVLARRAAA